MYNNFRFRSKLIRIVMENVFLCGVLFTFCLIKYNSAQALPTQSDRDLSTFVADFFSFNKTVLESYTPPPTKDEKIIQLVNSIFNNKSLSEPQAVIVSIKTTYLH